jgi:hypothetical protein
LWLLLKPSLLFDWSMNVRVSGSVVARNSVPHWNSCSLVSNFAVWTYGSTSRATDAFDISRSRAVVFRGHHRACFPCHGRSGVAHPMSHPRAPFGERICAKRCMRLEGRLNVVQGTRCYDVGRDASAEMLERKRSRAVGRIHAARCPTS